MRLLVAAGLFLISLVPAQAASPEQLLKTWAKENSACRGRSGNLPSTWDACDRREATAHLLGKANYCYGKKTDTAGYQANWHKCTTNSLRP